MEELSRDLGKENAESLLRQHDDLDVGRSVRVLRQRRRHPGRLGLPGEKRVNSSQRGLRGTRQFPEETSKGCGGVGEGESSSEGSIQRFPSHTVFRNCYKGVYQKGGA